MNTKPLSLDVIKLDHETQSRIAINEDAVEDYANILRFEPPDSWPFPPIDVFCDGSEYHAADGFHRCLGAKRANRSSAPCVIHKGTAYDARIFAMTANDRHGMRLSRADKRSNVEWLLDNRPAMTQKEIAEKAGVGRTLVQSIVSDRKPKIVPPPPLATKARNGNSPPQIDRQRAGLQPEVGNDDHTEETAKPNSGKPPKQYDRSFWYKQWNTSIGPLVRLVDKIAREVNEMHGARHKGVKEGLDLATRNMIEWMGVKK